MAFRDHFIPVASQIPFDNTGSAFSSTDAESAIKETLLLSGSSRYPITLGKQGNVNNAYLDRWNQVSSNTSPFIIPESGIIKSMSSSISTVGGANATITIYKNAISIQTITILAGNKKASLSGLSISVSVLDEISAQVTNGSMKDPVLAIFIQTGA